MKLQSITLCVEKEYEKSRWCMETLKGLYEAVSKHKIVLDLKYDEAVFKVRKDEIIMVLGTTQSWFVDVLSKLNPYECRIILISNSPFDLRGNINRVVFDREEAMLSAIRYIAATERKLCALFGFNPNSSSDVKRYKMFLENCNTFGICANEESLFLNNGSIKNCFDELIQNISKYNSIICANDAVAVYLAKNAIQKGYTIPEDFYILGFGNSVLSEIITPSLSTIALDYHEIGKHAVDAYLYLLKHPGISSMDIFIPCKIVPRQSTDYKEFTLENEIIYTPKINNHDLFFDDPDINEFFGLENFFEQCDEIDIEIIKGLREEVRYESLAQKLHISEYTLKYRIKKIYTQTNTSDRSSFNSIMEKYKINI